MIADGAQGTVTIWKSGRKGLYADDHGVTVRNPASRPRRFAWPEISRFEEGGGYDSHTGSYIWTLVIVLHTGQKVSACPGWYGAHTLNTVAAVRQVAERYGIPADLAGVPMKDGRPARRGLYHDPGGQAGLRYWDGRQWSPLLPPGIVKPRSVTLQESPASWSALPMADGPWTYGAARATRLMVWFIVFAAVSALLVAGALVVQRRWDHGTNSDPSILVWMGAAVFAVWTLRAWMGRRFFLKLERAVKEARSDS
jgi:hypothetical protein